MLGYAGFSLQSGTLLKTNYITDIFLQILLNYFQLPSYPWDNCNQLPVNIHHLPLRGITQYLINININVLLNGIIWDKVFKNGFFKYSKIFLGPFFVPFMMLVKVNKLLLINIFRILYWWYPFTFSFPGGSFFLP